MDKTFQFIETKNKPIKNEQKKKKREKIVENELFLSVCEFLSLLITKGEYGLSLPLSSCEQLSLSSAITWLPD